MKLSNKNKVFLSVIMSALMAYTPSFAAAHGGMIATTSVVADLSREQAQQKIENYLDRADVQQVLLDQGVSADEVKSRLASLSQEEMKQLTGQIEQARAGGDILWTILIVVLIIFLIKRI